MVCRVRYAEASGKRKRNLQKVSSNNFPNCSAKVSGCVPSAPLRRGQQWAVRWEGRGKPMGTSSSGQVGTHPPGEQESASKEGNLHVIYLWLCQPPGWWLSLVAKSIWVMARAGMNPGSALSWLCCSEQVASPSWIWRARTIVSTLQDCMRKKRDHSRNTRGTQSPQSRGWVELNRC